MCPHDFCQLVDEETVALELNLLIFLNALIPRCIEEVERRYCIGEEPKDDGQ